MMSWKIKLLLISEACPVTTGRFDSCSNLGNTDKDVLSTQVFEMVIEQHTRVLSLIRLYHFLFLKGVGNY